MTLVTKENAPCRGFIKMKQSCNRQEGMTTEQLRIPTPEIYLNGLNSEDRSGKKDTPHI